MKPELPDPIAEVLEDTASEARVQRMWRANEQRRSPRRRRAPLVVAGGVALAAAALALFFVTRDDGPLRLASGGALGAAEGRSELRLDDGSRIALEEGARIEPLRNDEAAIHLLLARGRARFEVEPGGPRTWSIETGVATVEVVGTVFTITRGAGWAEVEVERGVVMVRGEQVPERAVRLVRGRSIRVGAAPVARAGIDAAAPSEPRGAAATDPRARREETPRAASGETRSSADAIEPRTSEDEATRAASSEPRSSQGDPSEPATIEDANVLMSRADDARRAGRAEEAAALLARALARSDDPAAGVAAFTLGRLELDVLHRPERAARAFERALELALPPRLREDAAARRVEALAQTGDAGATRAAADAYLRDHPAGRHAARVRALAAR